MNETKAFMEAEKIPSLMAKYAVPCVISLLVGALYNIVDQIFIANAVYLGSYGNAANTVVFPLTVVALAVAVMFGDGCCAFVSIYLGSGADGKAHQGVGNTIVLTISSSLVITLLYLFFDDQILAAFGGTVNKTTYALSKEYFFYITLGIPFYMFGQAMNPVIRSDGSPRFAMVSTLLGAILNIILDPVFIFVFRWGMMGAAVATVIGQVATTLLSVWYLRHTRLIKLELSSFRPVPSLILRMASLGLCSFLSQISLVASMAASNNMIRKYGAVDPVFSQPELAQIPMAVVGIVMKFFQIVISVVIGISAGCIPIVGYNTGAGRPERNKELLGRLITAESLVGLAAFILAELCPAQLIGIFGAKNESVYYTAFAIHAFRSYLCMVILACINKAAFIFLQALGKALASTLLSMLREIVFGVGLTLLLPIFFGLDGVLYAMPVADALTFTASFAVILSTYRQFSREIHS